LLDFGASPRIVAEDVLERIGGRTAHPAYIESFAVDVPEDAGSGQRAWLTPRPFRGRLSKVALLLGWTLFGLAFGLGVLAGWLIWG
jgi:hypothetical protein